MAGPIYFAWVDPDTAWSAVTHAVMDEDVFGFELTHREGDFAILTVDIRNPNVGLLSVGRKQWAWFAIDDAEGNPVPRFFGRLEAIPEDIDRAEIRLTFIAMPSDYDARKRALAATLRADPHHWDPIWFRPELRDDPDTVFESRPHRIHIDPVTHAVTASHILTGEDGTIALGTADVIDGTMSISYGAPPLRQIQVTADVFWDQKAAGEVDLSQNIVDAFAVAGTGKPFLITSYTGEGLMRNWPRAGDNIGAGWSVGTTEVNFVKQTERDVDLKIILPKDDSFSELFLGNTVEVTFFKWIMSQEFAAAYVRDARREERMTFTLSADVQAVLTNPGEEEVLPLALSSQSVSETVDPEDPDALPIGDVRRRAYFTTERGRRSVAFLITLASTHLLSRARAVEIGFEIPFATALTLALSCRKNVVLTNPNLPGGTATGKIVGYSLSGNTVSGEFNAAIVIACCIGKGQSVSAAAGTPVYVEDGVLEDGIQLRTGQTFVVGTAPHQVAYPEFGGTVPNDDGFDFFDLQPTDVIETLVVTNGETAQEAVFNQAHADIAAAVEALKAARTRVCLTLKPMAGGPFLTEYPLGDLVVMAPKTFDLEAGAV